MKTPTLLSKFKVYKRRAGTGGIFGLTKSEKHGILNKSSGESDRRTGTTGVVEKNENKVLRKNEKVFLKKSYKPLDKPKKMWYNK